MVIHPGNPDEVYPLVGQGDRGTSEDWETDEHALIDAVVVLKPLTICLRS